MENREIKIVFMGTPLFGAIILKKLSDTPYRPFLVITSPNKPKGRKQVLTLPAVKLAAKEKNIKIIQPLKIKDSKSEIISLKPDLGVVAAYGKILPKEILDIPKYGFLNVHPSLLPCWRGASPIQYTILNGDEKTGISIIKMTEGMDEGPIVEMSKSKCQMSNINAKELTKKLAELGGDLLAETIPRWVSGKITPQPQNDSEATYTKIIKKEDGRINWQNSAESIERKIRAFYPWPGAFSFWNKKRIKITEGKVLKLAENSSLPIPGKVFLGSNKKPAVLAGKDALIIEKIQLEGKKEMSSKEFLRGHGDFIGSIMEG